MTERCFVRSVLVSAMTGAVVTFASAQVTLRGGERLDDPVVSVSIEGVEVAGAAPRIIGWDHVRNVEGEHASEATQFTEISDKAWRARTRLERGDITLAQPLFEELFAIYRDKNGPTAVLIANGLLRCRLAHQAQTAAVEPWLVAFGLWRQGKTVSADSAPIMNVLDSQTGLAPTLPPIWLDSASVSAYAQSSGVDAPDPVAQTLAQLYRATAAKSVGLDAPALSELSDLDDPSVQLVAHMLAAVSDEGSVRATARTWLRSGLDRAEGTWQEAWRRAALGRSLLMEDSIADRRLGMVQLLHVPARFKNEQRYLAGVALALVSHELRQEGDIAGADRLEQELVELDSAHPALNWLRRQPIDQSAATARPKTAQKERT